MPKVPKNPTDIFAAFTADYKQIFGNNLVSIALYGSGAKGEYRYKKSDINFLIVLTETGIENLKQCLPLIPKWHKRNVSTPLFLTKDYISSSLDAFPIEFLDMSINHQLVYGEDIFADVEIEEDDLRLQCERELRGKLLHLRENFLNSARNVRSLKMVISQSVSTFTPIFSTLLKLSDTEPPQKRADVFKHVTEKFQLNRDIFDQLLSIRENKLKISKNNLHTLMEQYIAEIKKLIEAVDKM